MVKQKYKITRLNHFHSQLKFVGRTFEYKYFSKSRMFKCHFTNANIRHVNFKGSIITSCGFKNATIYGVDFLGTNLKNCNFRGAHLEKVIYVGAKLDGCSFKNTKFNDVIFVNTNLNVTKNLCIDSGVEILNKYPKVQISAELKTILDDLKNCNKIFKTKVLHLPNKRYNHLNLFLLLRKFSEDDLIRGLNIAKDRVKKDLCTYSCLEKFLKKHLISDKILNVPPLQS